MKIKGLVILLESGKSTLREDARGQLNSHSTLGRSWAITCTPLPAGTKGEGREISFYLCLPHRECQLTNHTQGHSPMKEGRCQGPEMLGLNAEKVPCCLPVLSFTPT